MFFDGYWQEMEKKMEFLWEKRVECKETEKECKVNNNNEEFKDCKSKFLYSKCKVSISDNIKYDNYLSETELINSQNEVECKLKDSKCKIDTSLKEPQDLECKDNEKECKVIEDEIESDWEFEGFEEEDIEDEEEYLNDEDYVVDSDNMEDIIINSQNEVKCKIQDSKCKIDTNLKELQDLECKDIEKECKVEFPVEDINGNNWNFDRENSDYRKYQIDHEIIENQDIKNSECKLQDSECKIDNSLIELQDLECKDNIEKCKVDENKKEIKNEVYEGMEEKQGEENVFTDSLNYDNNNINHKNTVINSQNEVECKLKDSKCKIDSNNLENQTSECKLQDSKCKVSNDDERRRKIELIKKMVQMKKGESKQDKITRYSNMKEKDLFQEVKKFLMEKDIAHNTVDIKILEDEFGKNNIVKLVIGNYLILMGKGITIGL